MEQIERLLKHLQLGHGWQLKPISGGCIAQSFHAREPDGSELFIKYQPRAQTDQLQREAEGLEQLSATGKVQTPKVVAVNDQLLALEWIPTVPATTQTWQQLGRQLAQLHRQPVPCFGFAQSNYCGSTLQPNLPTDNGFEFFAEQRLLYQARLAHQQRLLSSQQVDQINQLGARLPQLLPQQPPALIHGDLWSGNVLFSQQQGEQQPFLIDPAAHYGWAEAELAMTKLFGGFDDQFYQAYNEINPLESGWSERADIYNLYHLLNHLNLFGSSYLAQVEGIIHRYCRSSG